MSRGTSCVSSVGHHEPGAASHQLETQDGLLPAPSMSLRRAPGTGDAWGFLLSFFYSLLSGLDPPWWLRRGLGCPLLLQLRHLGFPRR